MKKAISLLMVFLLFFCLCACTENPTEETTVTVSPVEIAKEKLSTAYTTCCRGDNKNYVSLGYDKMSLTIDTIPDNGYYPDTTSNAISAIKSVNSYLGLPSSLWDKMSSTRALDGMQSQNYGEFTVTWNYHPDKGLKVIYEVNL